MHVCLSLGFEGQYRTVEGGGTLLARIRAAIYEAVRRIHPRPDEDLSKSWTPVLIGGRRRFSSIPVWVIAGVAAAALVAFFATLSRCYHARVPQWPRRFTHSTRQSSASH